MKEILGNVQTVIQTHQWSLLTEPILLSVLEQESGVDPFFEKSDNQYKQNMRVASGALGMTETQVSKLITTSSGKIAKFRLEPSWFFSRKTEHLPKEKRFYYCSSVGMGQIMGFNLLNKTPTHQYASTWLEFASNPIAQIKRTAQDFDALLVKAKLDPKIKDKSLKNLVFKAYVGYNAGNIHSTNKDAQKRAQEVVNRLK